MLNIILILILQLCYVPMLALRTICMVKKLTLLTAFFGFVESLIYIFGLAIVLSGDQTVISMLIYAAGFGLGLVVGIHIENKIAIGYTSVYANIGNQNNALIEELRQKGFGVTVFEGQGKSSTRFRLEILTKRSQELELFQLIEQYEPSAFVTAFEPTRFKGGYLTALMRKQNKPFTRRDVTSAASSTHNELSESDSWLKKTTDEIIHEVHELTHPTED